jgi:hypothetical protein
MEKHANTYERRISLNRDQEQSMLHLLANKLNEEISNGTKITNRTIHLFPLLIKRYGNTVPEL